MRHHNRILLIAGILLVATTLRAPFTIIAPLLEGLQKDYQLSATQVGLLITGPVLAFAAVSPFAAGLARRWGMERTLFGSLAVITAGVLVRASGGVVALYVGTIIVGTGIALGNVLLPSLLKRDFPTKVAALTALYVLTMGVAAALSGMAQCLGYLFASAAPPLAGKAMELAGSWHVPLTVCAGLGVVMAYVGTLAGRHLQIGRPTPSVALARMSNPT